MNLDQMLSQPLPEIPDRHFSAAVMAEMARQEIRRARIETAAWTLLVVVIVGTLAATEPGRKLAAAALSLNLFAQICVGLVILLSLFPLRIAPE